LLDTALDAIQSAVRHSVQWCAANRGRGCVPLQSLVLLDLAEGEEEQRKGSGERQQEREAATASTSFLPPSSASIWRSSQWLPPLEPFARLNVGRWREALTTQTGQIPLHSTAAPPATCPFSTPPHTLLCSGVCFTFCPTRPSHCPSARPTSTLRRGGQRPLNFRLRPVPPQSRRAGRRRNQRKAQLRGPDERCHLDTLPCFPL
jgi:hypothetical protein